jgi:transmembrane sensor
VLHAGDVGVLEPAGQTVVRRGAATEDDVAWTRGRLVFNEAPVSRVIAELRRWYGVELVVADSVLARRHLQATFEGESLDQVLEVIRTALGGVLERRGDTVIVRARESGSSR